MSKSISNKKFKTQARDLYETWDSRAHDALANHLPVKPFTYIEPCAGSGELIKGITNVSAHAHCVQASDIHPLPTVCHLQIDQIDGVSGAYVPADYIITNPPFSQVYKDICFAIMKKSMLHANEGAWFLIPGNWPYNSDFQWAMSNCSKVVPIGRMKWIRGSNHSESKDCIWALFHKDKRNTVLEARK